MLVDKPELPFRKVISHHALRNALIPTVTVVGLQVGVLLGGNMIIETVFGWPGLGKLIMDSITNRDYPVVQAGIFVTSSIFVICNLIVDLLYGVIDPRIRYN